MKARRAEKTPSGTIHRTIALLREALVELGADMPLAEEERVGVMINQAMAAEARSFHTPEHVFDLVQPGRPHLTLAALLHDVVYYQVDQGFVPQTAKLAQASVETHNGELRIRAGVDPADQPLAITTAVFGMQPGWTLSPFCGMNEFLSALVMNRSLGGVVRAADLLCATACIEATTPFRMPDAVGRTPPVILVERLKGATVRLGLGLSEEALKDVVRHATFSNADVANFGESEVTRFLDNK